MMIISFKEVIKMIVKYKPGQVVKVAGQYAMVGPRGGLLGRTANLTVGDKFPPTPSVNEYWVKS